MDLEPLHLLYAALFTGMLLIEGIYFLVKDWRDGHERAINRRLRMIGSKGDARAVLRKLRREDRPLLSAAVVRLAPRLDRLITEAGLTMPGGRLALLQVALLQVALAVMAYAVLRLMTPLALWQALPAAIVAGFGLPVAVLLEKRRQRLKRFAEQLPDALDLIVRSLRAGHPVATAMAMVAKEMHDPIGTEFGIAIDEMTYGLTMDEALRNMAVRVPLQDLKFLVVTVQIQNNTGGNLAEVLSNLSSVIRARFIMFSKVRAISAEGRLGGMLVSALPFLVAGAVSVLNPDYFGEVSADPLFVPLLLAAGLLLIIGQFMIYRLVQIRV